MSPDTKVLLKASALQHVHLNIYLQDFTFIVNDDEFHTSSLVYDLLSPTISDPTFSTTDRSDFLRIHCLSTHQHPPKRVNRL